MSTDLTLDTGVEVPESVLRQRATALSHTTNLELAKLLRWQAVQYLRAGDRQLFNRLADVASAYADYLLRD
jgi:hypothetical protein